MGVRDFLIYDFGKLIPDKLWIQIKYLQWFHKFPDLKHPKTYNEKLNWLKLYDRKPEYTTMVDKYEVKKWISDRVGSQYVIPVVGGPWNSFNEINFERLPDQFVLKTTHDCGGVYIVKDKNKINMEEAEAFLTEHLQTNYFMTCREWPYKNVKPRIFAEKYMTDKGGTLQNRGGQEVELEVDSQTERNCSLKDKQIDFNGISVLEKEQLTDFKFFCFDGIPKFMFIATDRISKTEETKFDFFDMNFKHLPFRQGHPNSNVKIDRPASFDLMKELAGKLSKGMPQLRVDFYQVDGQVYVGELTFYHFSGLVPFVPSEWDYKFGSWIHLPLES